MTPDVIKQKLKTALANWKQQAAISRMLKNQRAGTVPRPLPLSVDPTLAHEPALNVLLPSLSLSAMTGGPNTVINLTYRLAAEGVRVRYIGTDGSDETNTNGLWEHFGAVSGIRKRLANVEFHPFTARARQITIGTNDVFCASWWATAHLAREATAKTNSKQFIYFIQDFEPAFYPWSTNHALALETYDMDYVAVINEGSLAEYLMENKIGKFANPAFLEQCAVFEPAVDLRMFQRTTTNRSGQHRTLLFYARPNRPRNLFEIGVQALRKAVEQGAFAKETWRFYSIGAPLQDIELAPGVILQNLPWTNYARYAENMANADIVLSLMLSPHTSYPPLEAAAAGGISVTNTFGTKTVEKLHHYSPNIIGVAPTVDAIADGLHTATKRCQDKNRNVGNVNVPTTWDEAFAETVPRLRKMLGGM